MPAHVQVSSSWKTVSALYTRVGGSWKNVVEGYTRIGGAWKQFFSSGPTPITVNYLVIAGGGGGGSSYNSGSGGGGAGGYRTTVGTSGGGASAETSLSLIQGVNYTVTVGAGGNGTPAPGPTGAQSNGSNGSNSVFGSITSTGGGGGAGGNDRYVGSTGGSGGGSQAGRGASSGTSNQGFAGGTAPSAVSLATDNAGGGGGAGAVGGNASGTSAGAGGAGVASSITGTSVTRGGGGGGGTRTSINIGAGGNGGGGSGGGYVPSGNDGNATIAPTAGTPNTGGGGGGTGEGLTPMNGANGGSGVVIIRYPSTYDIRNGAGLTYTTSVVGSDKVTVFTAGTGNIQFASAANSSFVLLETVTLTSNQASVEFANLNSKYGSTYQHLQVRFVARSTYSGYPVFDTGMRFNSDTGSNYSWHQLLGLGSGGAISEGSANQTSMRCGVGAANSLSSSIYGASIVDILDPFETTKFKTIRSLDGTMGSATNGNYVMLHSGSWRNTAAVTSITLIDQYGGNFVTGSRFALYGLRGS